jgi:hypothetical protein
MPIAISVTHISIAGRCQNDGCVTLVHEGLQQLPDSIYQDHEDSRVTKGFAID